MRTTNFNAIAASSPLDKTASVVRDGSGDQYEGKVPSWHAHWKAPPLPEATFKGDADLAGLDFGKGMKVVRYHRRNPRMKTAQWLVRCSCGDYELRSTRSIRTADSTHVCQACHWFQHVKWQVANERKGRTVASSDAAILNKLAEKAGA